MQGKRLFYVYVSKYISTYLLLPKEGLSVVKMQVVHVHHQNQSLVEA